MSHFHILHKEITLVTINICYYRTSFNIHILIKNKKLLNEGPVLQISPSKVEAISYQSAASLKSLIKRGILAY